MLGLANAHGGNNINRSIWDYSISPTSHTEWPSFNQLYSTNQNDATVASNFYNLPTTEPGGKMTFYTSTFLKAAEKGCAAYNWEKIVETVEKFKTILAPVIDETFLGDITWNSELHEAFSQSSRNGTPIKKKYGPIGEKFRFSPPLTFGPIIVLSDKDNPPIGKDVVARDEPVNALGVIGDSPARLADKLSSLFTPEKDKLAPTMDSSSPRMDAEVGEIFDDFFGKTPAGMATTGADSEPNKSGSNGKDQPSMLSSSSPLEEKRPEVTDDAGIVRNFMDLLVSMLPAGVDLAASLDAAVALPAEQEPTERNKAEGIALDCKQNLGQYGCVSRALEILNAHYEANPWYYMNDKENVDPLEHKDNVIDHRSKLVNFPRKRNYQNGNWKPRRRHSCPHQAANSDPVNPNKKTQRRFSHDPNVHGNIKKWQQQQHRQKPRDYRAFWDKEVGWYKNYRSQQQWRDCDLHAQTTHESKPECRELPAILQPGIKELENNLKARERQNQDKIHKSNSNEYKFFANSKMWKHNKNQNEADGNNKKTWTKQQDANKLRENGEFKKGDNNFKQGAKKKYWRPRANYNVNSKNLYANKVGFNLSPAMVMTN